MSPSATIKEDLTRGGLSDSFGLSIISCYDSDNESPEMQDTGSATRLARPESRHVALPSAQLPKFKLIDYRVFTPELVGTAPPITPGNSYQYRITANALQHANN